MELLKEWLCRAQHHPLTIHLDCRDETRAQILVDVVESYGPQWRDVRFSLPLSGFQQLNTSAFPLLERLALSAPYPSTGVTNPIIIQDAPLLLEATLTHIPSFRTNLPMKSLVILYVRFMGISQIMAVLRCCPNLEDLTCQPTESGEFHDPPVELHALRWLYIPTVHLLSYLTAPCLERLRIGQGMHPLRPTTDVLRAFISRSSCAPKFLSTIAPTAGPVEEVQGVFRALNTIEHLQLVIRPAWVQELQALRSADVFPLLRHLEVSGIGPIEGDCARLLLDVVAWRSTHGVLESFKLVVTLMEPHDVPAATTIAEFRALGEAGLHVRIVTEEWGGTSPDVVLLDTRLPTNRGSQSRRFSRDSGPPFWNDSDFIKAWENRQNRESRRIAQNRRIASGAD